MNIIKTMCARDCPDACFLDAYVENGVLVKVEASGENPVTAGVGCPRSAGDVQRVYSMQRVLNPYIRKEEGQGFRLSEWDKALGLVASKLKQVLDEHGPEKVLLLDYEGNVGLITYLYSKRLWNHLGVTRTDYTMCSASGHAALQLHYGLSYGNDPEALLNKKTIVFWGFNARYSSPHQWRLAQMARLRNKATIVSVDSRESETAESANLHIVPRPGTDVALAYGVARYLITNHLVDQDFINEYTVGFEAYREEAMKWLPERVEDVTGLPLEGVEELAKTLKESPDTVIMMGLGLQKSKTGAEAIRAVSLLPALLGIHRGFYYTNSRGRYFQGDLAGTGLLQKTPKTVSQISVAQRIKNGEFKFIWVNGSNPVNVIPDSKSMVEGLQRSDVFTVVHETHLTDTCNNASVVLPAPTFYEKDDLVLCDSHPYVRKACKAIDPEGNSMTERWVMWELAKRLGVEEEAIYADPWKEAETMFKGSFEQGDFPDYLEGEVLKLKHRPDHEYQTPSGRIEFTSSGKDVNPLPKQLDVSIAEDEFIVLNSAIPNYTHTQFQDVYDEIPCAAWINPADAEKHGIVEGSEFTVYNEHGELHVTAKVTGKVTSGILWMPRELKDRKGNYQNTLAPNTPQAIGGGPMYNSIRVRVRQ